MENFILLGIAANPLINFLIYALVIAVVGYVIILLMNLFGVPDPMRKIILLILALVALLWLLSVFGIFKI